MKDKENIPKSIKFVYENSDDYKVIYVNGIHGGMTTHGELNIDFFLEHRHLVKSEVHSITEEGVLGPKIETESELDSSEDQLTIIRERKIGIILSLETASSIGQWMLDKVEEFKELAKKKQE